MGRGWWQQSATSISQCKRRRDEGKYFVYVSIVFSQLTAVVRLLCMHKGGKQMCCNF